jgi:hypothetical protein
MVKSGLDPHMIIELLKIELIFFLVNFCDLAEYQP